MPPALEARCVRGHRMCGVTFPPGLTPPPVFKSQNTAELISATPEIQVPPVAHALNFQADLNSCVARS